MEKLRARVPHVLVVVRFAYLSARIRSRTRQLLYVSRKVIVSSGRPNYTRVVELRESSERLREQRQLLVRLFSISSISVVLRVRN